MIRPFGDFPQRNDGGLVVLPFHERFGPVRQFPCALGGNHDEVEQVVDVFQAVFDGYASHFGFTGIVVRGRVA